MKISELAKVSETPISTIRYYMAENILPPPVKTGKTISLYGDAHVRRLTAIRELKAKKISIRAMKELFGRSDPEDSGYDAENVRNMKREALLKAAVEVFREKGYSETTIADIVGRAGIGRNTFYTHYTNKEELFLECADHIFDDLESVAGPGDVDEDLKTRLSRRLEHVFKNPHLFDMLNLIKGSSVSNPAFRRKLLDVIRAYIRPIKKELDAGYRQGVFKKVDYTLFGYLLMGLVEYGYYYYRDEGDPPCSELSQILMEFVLSGLKI